MPPSSGGDPLYASRAVPAAGENGLGLDFGFVDSNESRMDREEVGWSSEGVGRDGEDQRVDPFHTLGWPGQVPEAESYEAGWDEGMRSLLQELEGEAAAGPYIGVSGGAEESIARSWGGVHV